MKKVGIVIALWSVAVAGCNWESDAKLDRLEAEQVQAQLPVLLTVMATANVPRPPGAKRMMKYKKARSGSELAIAAKNENPDGSKEDLQAQADQRAATLEKKGMLIEQWDLDDIEADLDWCGMSGSPTKVHKIQSVVLSGGEYHEVPPTPEGIAEMVGDLISEHTIG